MFNNANTKSLIDGARVARLATVDSENIPHVVPVVFVFDGEHYYVPIDEKTKKDKLGTLKRVKNIQKNPNIALLIDKYDEDWSKLLFVMIHGKASLIGKQGQERDAQLEKAHKLLYVKYHQYEKIGIGEMCIKIYPEKVITWQMND
jgi:PPOX class probable F420-dependent enzyme